MRIALRGWIGFVEATSIDWVARRDVGKAELVELLKLVLYDAVTRATGVAAQPIAERTGHDGAASGPPRQAGSQASPGPRARGAGPTTSRRRSG